MNVNNNLNNNNILRSRPGYKSGIKDSLPIDCPAYHILRHPRTLKRLNQPCFTDKIKEKIGTFVYNFKRIFHLRKYY